MLDFAFRSMAGVPAGSIPAGQSADAAASLSPAGVRALFGRIAARRAAPSAAEPRRDAQARPCNPALRARAEAAFRIVDGSGAPALDAALGVMEAEIARMRAAVIAYGEALKSIEVYAQDDGARRAARAALRAWPERLQAAEPVPSASLRHG